MEMTLKVKTEDLRAKAAELENSIKELEEHFNNLQDIVARSSGYWVGSAGDKARRAFDSKKEDTDMAIKRFKEHPGDLLVMAGIYEQYEKNVVEENKALSTDPIV